MKAGAPTGRDVRGYSAALLAVAASLAAVASAGAATYHSPHYQGIKHAPHTAPPEVGTLPPVTVGQGNHPSVIVDAAGTAHIAWTTDDGDQADALHYCRLPRGATACDSTSLLRPEHPYGGGDGPSVNIESGGPQLYAVGDELVMVSHRSATSFPHPDSSPTSSTTLIYTSEDGGSNWSGPAIVGTAPIGGPGVVYGSDANPQIATISQTVTGGTFFQALSPGAFTSASANVGDGSQQWFSGSLAVDNGLPVAGYTDGDSVFIRRWTGNGSANNLSTWAAPVAYTGDDPQITGGPSGLYLMDDESPGGPLIIHKIDGASEGAGTPISGDDPANQRIIQGPDGRLVAGWVMPATGDLDLNTAPGGSGWSKEGTSIFSTQDSMNETDLGVAADGGGFAVVHQGGGTATEAQITAVPFGNQGATGQLGLGGLTGGEGGDPGATAGCNEITFGAVIMHPAQGCFLHGLGKNKTTEVADGPIELNGLTITPAGGAKAKRAGGTQIVISPKQHTLDTTGPVTVSAAGGNAPPVVLWQGELHVKLPNAGAGETLFDFPTSAFASKVEGFPISGDAPVVLTNGGVKIPVDLALPSEFGGALGSATLAVTSPAGLDVSSLDIKIPDANVGPLEFQGVEITYDGGADTWSGGGTVKIIGPDISFGVHVVFKDGDYQSGNLTVTEFPGYPVYPPFDVYLNQIALGLALKPHVEITGGARFGAFPIADPLFALSALGQFDASFGSPFSIAVTGTGYVLNTQVANTALSYSGDGSASFTSDVTLGNTDVGLIGSLTLAIAKASQFNGDLIAKACLVGCVDAVHVAASNKGVAVCLPAGGLEHDWDSLIPIEWAYTCPAGDFSPDSTKRAGTGFNVPDGLPAFTARLDGATGAPQVSAVSGPNGPVALGAISDPSAAATKLTIGNSTYIGLRTPVGGNYTYTLASGSPAVATVQGALSYDTPKVTSAKVGGHGNRRSLTYKLDPVAGVQVDFVETTDAGDVVLGSTTGAHGTIKFKPAPGKAGKRPISARAIVDGRAWPLGQVASYKAPGPPKPGVVRTVHAHHAGSGIAVSFSKAANAADYLVAAKLPHHVSVTRLLPASKHSVKLPGIGKKTSAKVSVTTIAATGARSKPKTVRVGR